MNPPAVAMPPAEQPSRLLDVAVGEQQPRQVSAGWFGICFADILFVVVTLTLMQHASHGMMDDPGLGWHLRIADLMQEQGGFLHEEYFSYPSIGKPWMTRAWLSDIIMRTAYGWGGLNALAILTCMTVAVTLRCMYRSLRADLVHPLLALLCIVVCASEMRPSYTARPNIVSILGIWLIVDLCRKFHAGSVTHKQLFYWFAPIFALWANLHGSFMAGLVVIAMAWLIEGTLALGSWKKTARRAAHRRMYWLTMAGAVAGFASLLNPYGYRLHLWNLMSATDPFIQNNSTTIWLPLDFGELDFLIERLILLLPILALTCRKRINWVGMGLTVAWLHLAFNTRRYSTLWVIIAVPTLCEMAIGNPWLRRAVSKIQGLLEDDTREMLRDKAATRPNGLARWPFLGSGIAAAVLLFVSPWLPQWAVHHSMPAASLHRFLDEAYQGEKTFHSPNHGGFLTWHGWDKPQRFRTYMDDRLEVHGEELMNQYVRIATAEDGWQEELDEHAMRLVCIPTDMRLARELAKATSDWEECFVDDEVAVYRRRTPKDS